MGWQLIRLLCPRCRQISWQLLALNLFEQVNNLPSYSWDALWMMDRTSLCQGASQLAHYTQPLICCCSHCIYVPGSVVFLDNGDPKDIEGRGCNDWMSSGSGSMPLLAFTKHACRANVTCHLVAHAWMISMSWCIQAHLLHLCSWPSPARLLSAVPPCSQQSYV